MSKLFKEALNDAKKLREIAEQNATNKIIEAVAPRIKQLIENELMTDEEDIGFYDEDSSEETDEEEDSMGAMETEAVADDLVSDIGASLPSEVDPIDLSNDLNSMMMDSETAAPTEFSFEKDGKQVKVSVTVEGKQKSLKKMSVSNLLRALNETRSLKLKNAIMQEIRNIRKKLITMSEAGDKSSTLKLNALNLILKENTKMSKRKSSLNENAWWLLKEEDEEDMDSEEMELDIGEDDGGDAGIDIDVDAIKSAVADLASALDMEVEEAEEAEEAEDDDGDEEEDDAMDLDLEDMDDMDEMDHKDEMDEMYEMDDMDDMDEDADEMMEISESMLRREISKMTRGSKKPARRSRRRTTQRLAESRRKRMARRRRLAEMGDPMGAMHSFADQVIEVSEEDLINALADELGDAAGADLNIDGSGDASRAARSFGGGKATSEALKEARRARRQTKVAKRQLAEAKKQAILAKKELKESNLFNAKLLYVNKLMQGYSLNAKQQRAIVEALDNAKTLREAKLLYKTLTESLNKGRSAKKGSTMNESVSKTGSASKSVRSSAPTNNGSELGRWAVLAGLNK
jgi:hypothetical protein